MLTLNFKGVTGNMPVELAGLLPEKIASLSHLDVARSNVYVGNSVCPLGDIAVVTGSPKDLCWRLEGATQSINRLGQGMSAGEIFVKGSLGHYAGAELVGGKLRVEGNVGDWLGAELLGGTIHVAGHAGDYVGASYPGSKIGQQGGMILIEGNAGSEVARSMRRGILAVRGSVGSFVAADAIAGTVFVFGKVGARPAAGLKRAGLILFDDSTPSETLLPTFQRACVFEPAFIAIYARALTEAGFAIEGKLPTQWIRFTGDHLTGGKGEILIPSRQAA